MTDPRSTPPGNAITRAALDRVLARAAQLQGAAGDGDDAGTMTEAQIIELGKEVGLSSDVIRRALAEERSRAVVPEESGALEALAGPAVISAARTVPGAASAVLSALDGWMQRNEGLEVMRRFNDQLVWEARHDFFSRFRRALTASGTGLELAYAGSVTAIVADIAPGKSHVRVVADFSDARAQRSLRAVLIAALIGLISLGPLLAINVPLILAGIAGAVAPAVALLLSRSRYRQMVARAHVALEQALDRLEFGDTRPPTTAQVLLESFIGTPRKPK
jgi:hypothetical protein